MGLHIFANFGYYGGVMGDTFIRNNFSTAALIGDPIEHSVSPALHNFWLKQMGLQGRYESFRVAASQLPTWMCNLRPSHYAGVNVTLPHKQAILPLCDGLTPTAQAIGAVNTVWRDGSGKLCGGNSDAYGFAASLPLSARKGKIATLLGSGGAARAVVYALIILGYDEIRVCNRTYGRAQQLSQSFSACASARLRAFPQSQMDDSLHNSDLLINCSSAALQGDAVSLPNFSRLADTAIVTDITYRPFVSDFLKASSAAGYTIVPGLYMLIHQALFGFAQWFLSPGGLSPKQARLQLPDPYCSDLLAHLRQLL